MASLYDITGRAQMLMDMAEYGEVEEEVIKDTWEALEGELDVKVESCCKVVKNIEGDIKAIESEIKRLTEKKSTLENTTKRIKDMVFNSLKALGKDKAGGQILKASIQKNGGKLPLILDVDDDHIPFDFQKVTISANNEAIRDALDHGVELDFAHYGERGESLRIR